MDQRQLAIQRSLAPEPIRGHWWRAAWATYTRLPRELRDMVYQHVWSDEANRTMIPKHSRPAFVVPLIVGEDFAREAAEWYYEHGCLGRPVLLKNLKDFLVDDYFLLGVTPDITTMRKLAVRVEFELLVPTSVLVADVEARFNHLFRLRLMPGFNITIVLDIKFEERRIPNSVLALCHYIQRVIQAFEHKGCKVMVELDLVKIETQYDYFNGPYARGLNPASYHYLSMMTPVASPSNPLYHSNPINRWQRIESSPSLLYRIIDGEAAKDMLASTAYEWEQFLWSDKDLLRNVTPEARNANVPPSQPLSQNTSRTSLSTYKAQSRMSTSSRRNISSPYSLAIPPKNNRTSTSTSAISEYQQAKPTLAGTKSVERLRVPTPPKKAVLVSEKPIQPCVSNDKAISTTSSHHGYASPYIPAPKKKLEMNDRVLAFAVTLGLVLLLAIIIPLGIIIPQKLIKPLPINAIVPFYINPEQSGSWGRLYDAIVRHPDTNFTIIINPDSGPGTTVWPPAPYIDAIKTLNVHLNVKTLGYIDTKGGTRDNATIRSEIDIYAGWANVSDKLTLNGIYFDHTPWNYTEHAAAYLRNISAAVRRSDGGFGDERAWVVYNPGRVPFEDNTQRGHSKGLMPYKPDVTVVFEGVYDDMPRKNKLQDLLGSSKDDRAGRAMLVNSVPKDLGLGGLRKIVDDVRRDVGWLFVTDLSDDVYAGYGSIWEEWLNVMW
ncbi:hypothetical protein N0V83_006745 [Neocucurbitaria cava]|uniref:Uncharacterized protein n=1 Tax=Neocucurbitaria cava TaxID=798079 RepID=A0A9W9CLJ2_9PLEO|nr:hypothetical protein N0V83_006745 [Neocucurbitaria cava]